MAENIEREIHRRLRRQPDASVVAIELLSELNTDELNHDDFFALVTFALQAGCHRQLLENYARWFRRSPVVPWAQFLELIHRQNIKVNQQLLSAVLDGAKSQDAVGQLLLSHVWDQKNPRLPKLRQRYRQELIKNWEDRRSQLKEKLNFLRAQRMIAEEEKVLDQLKKEFPDDPEVTAARSGFKERWARAIIAKSQNTRPGKNDKIKLSAEETRFADALCEHTRNIASGQPSLAYDLALMFYFMDLPEYALVILRSAHLSPSAEWLYLELLMDARYYIECLEAVNAIELAHSDDPETVFSANYLRARCLWSFGQKTAAIDLMKSIVNVRPDYRSARSFITKWTGGLRED